MRTRTIMMRPLQNLRERENSFLGRIVLPTEKSSFDSGVSALCALTAALRMIVDEDCKICGTFIVWLFLAPMTLWLPGARFRRGGWRLPLAEKLSATGSRRRAFCRP